jgi:hypothetical protein
MKEPTVIEYDSQRILTTKQIAEFYEVDQQLLVNNFNRHRDRYTSGKHYFALEGRAKTDFLNLHQNDLGSKNAKVLYLWTEKGVLMHAKSVNTDRAWQVYEELVDTYFRKIEEAPKQSRDQRRFAWTAEAEQLRQLNMKYIKPGYFSMAEVVLQKLIYAKMDGITPNERAKIDISVGQFFSRYLKGDCTGQLKGCTVYPEHGYSKANIIEIGHVVDTKTGDEYPVKHYANLYKGDFDNFWDFWYLPEILPTYFNGRLPDGLPRVKRYIQ